MKKMFFMAAIVVLGASVCTAGPLNQKHLPADAQWGVHLNLETFWGSQMGKLVKADIMETAGEKIAALEQLLGSNLSEDLKAVTIYGTQGNHESAAALFYGKYDKAKLTSLLVLNEAYRKSEYSGKTIHHWVDDKSQESQAGAFAAENLIVISQEEDSVKAVLDVLAGTRKTLAEENDTVLNGLTAAPDNTILIMAATELPELIQGHHEAAILANSKMMAMLLAEENGDMKLQLDLTAQTPEAATQIEQALLGIKAFILLSQNENPDLPKILQNAVLTRDESQLSLEIAYPSAKLFDILKTLVANKVVTIDVHSPVSTSDTATTTD